ncbi:MAG: hypothetical protein U1E52_09040 [Geminicoccaceae bacterium]
MIETLLPEGGAAPAAPLRPGYLPAGAPIRDATPIIPQIRQCSMNPVGEPAGT